MDFALFFTTKFVCFCFSIFQDETRRFSQIIILIRFHPMGFLRIPDTYTYIRMCNVRK